jgi:hypothetical protein
VAVHTARLILAVTLGRCLEQGFRIDIIKHVLTLMLLNLVENLSVLLYFILLIRSSLNPDDLLLYLLAEYLFVNNSV